MGDDREGLEGFQLVIEQMADLIGDCQDRMAWIAVLYHSDHGHGFMTSPHTVQVDMENGTLVPC
jgi:hypothetical protein